jgi:hypothetical protein
MWLFPVFFMLHEFEEIIFLPGWLKQNIDEMAGKYPRPLGRLRPHFEAMSSAGFALAVAEEFIILSVLTFISVEYAFHSLFAALLLAYLLHVIIHCIQSLAIRRYVPAVATGILSGFYAVYALHRLNVFSSPDLVFIITITPAILALMTANLLIMHRVMARFEKWKRAGGIRD